MRAKGSKYKTSAWKSSNTENAYFTSEKHGTANDTVLSAEYGVANARHLYNIRFEEERNTTGKQYGFTYNLTDSFAWSGEGGIFQGTVGFGNISQRCGGSRERRRRRGSGLYRVSLY